MLLVPKLYLGMRLFAKLHFARRGMAPAKKSGGMATALKKRRIPALIRVELSAANRRHGRSGARNDGKQPSFVLPAVTT
jgi:hypothetical protein